MAYHNPETQHLTTKPRTSAELSTTEDDPRRTKSRTNRGKTRKSGILAEPAKNRTRSRSLNRRKSRKQALIYAYKQQTRNRIAVDPLPCTEEEGEEPNCVLRADSASPSVRRGRGYFRGVGDSFSTCRIRRRGRAKGELGVDVLAGKDGLLGRALSPSPERV